MKRNKFITLLAAIPALSAGAAEKQKKAKIRKRKLPDFEYHGTTLTVRKNNNTITIRNCFVTERPAADFDIEDLYNKNTGYLIVPMADSTYHLYNTNPPPELPEFESIIEGSRSLGMGKWGRSRKFWRFVKWIDDDTLQADADPLFDNERTESVNVNINKYQFYTHPNPNFRFKIVDIDKTTEREFELIESEK